MARSVPTGHPYSGKSEIPQDRPGNMSSIGTGYDLSVTSYSPEGRLFQIEYAEKAVKITGTAIAMCCSDGVVFGVENLRSSRLLEKNACDRIETVDRHIGFASAGWHPDAMSIADKARDEAKSYKQFYARILSERIAGHVHQSTWYSPLRPFGVSSLIGGFPPGSEEPELFMVNPAGTMWGYFGVAIGKGEQQARSEMEKIRMNQMTCRDGVKEIARIIYQVHDFVKDREFELELSWVCDESQRVHCSVPDDVLEEAKALADRARRRGDPDAEDGDLDEEMGE